MVVARTAGDGGRGWKLPGGGLDGPGSARVVRRWPRWELGRARLQNWM